MSEDIPKEIKENFEIISDNIKYPCYPNEDFQKSILDDDNLSNYTEENINIIFNEFFNLLSSCKNKYYEIVENNIHKFQDYCLGLNVKCMYYVFYFSMIEMFAKLVESKYHKEQLTEKFMDEIFFDQILFGCERMNDNFHILYKKEYNDQNEISKLKKLFNPIIEKYNIILKRENEIGNILIRTIKYFTKNVLKQFEEELIRFKNIKIFFQNNYFKTKNNEENEIIILNLLLYLKNIEVLEFALYNSALLDKNDICNISEQSQKWKNLKKMLIRLVPKDNEELKERIKRRSNDMMTSIISNVEINDSDSASSIIFSGIKNYLYYKMNDNRARIDSKKYKLANKIDNIKESRKIHKISKPIFAKFLPNIEFRRKIYVKKEFSFIDRNYIKKLINFMNGENIPVDSHNNKDKNIKILPLYFKDKMEYKDIKRNYVSVTILNNKKLYFKNEKEEGFFSSIINKFKKDDNIINNIENEFTKNTIMIAIHGGGFVGSSTFEHEIYLRKWAKEINIPIFGINYSLSPEYKYPEGINDVYQAYMWIINHAKEELNMDIKHIILYGDSAGANIMLSLNSLLIAIKEYELNLEDKILLPELLLVFYPITYLGYNNYSNSIMSCLDNFSLRPDMMKFLIKQYVGEYELQNKDPFLNPIKLNNFILERIKSKIRIYFGSQDVLRDDSIKLLNVFCEYNNKINNNNKIDARGYDILYLGHGFNVSNEIIQNIYRNALMPEIKEFLNNIN